MNELTSAQVVLGSGSNALNKDVLAIQLKHKFSLGFAFFSALGLVFSSAILLAQSGSLAAKKQKKDEARVFEGGDKANDSEMREASAVNSPQIVATPATSSPQMVATPAAVRIKQRLNDTVRRYYEMQLIELKKYPFNKTELMIAALILRGSTSREIANHMHIAEITVKKYAQQIVKKTGVENRHEFSNLIKRKLEQETN